MPQLILFRYNGETGFHKSEASKSKEILGYYRPLIGGS